MAGKSPELCSARVAHALDKLSKNTLIDLAVDLAIRQIGEESATDEALIEVLQEWINPILRLRNSSPVSLSGAMAKWDEFERKYLAKQAQSQ